MTFELHEVDWIKRYFSHSNDGRVFAYLDGRTSKTKTIVSSWDCARLVEDDND